MKDAVRNIIFLLSERQVSGMSETLRDLVVSLSLNSDNFTRNIKSINKADPGSGSAFRPGLCGR